ncbi:hypothetical protein GCM10009555_036190 [Acrocarpospora macrocephala]|uniref:Uncharacterized protein n=1 Tax=Acrocarpospora macrocephala TaxID=150177 RepID=A0A5M3WWH2_9ACTN|nr:hypothetical protein Amac_074040 [Acrocarpospora macrocephala]
MTGPGKEAVRVVVRAEGWEACPVRGCGVGKRWRPERTGWRVVRGLTEILGEGSGGQAGEKVVQRTWRMVAAVSDHS